MVIKPWSILKSIVFINTLLFCFQNSYSEEIEIEIVGWVSGQTADSSSKTALYIINSVGIDLEIEVLLNEKVRVLKHPDSSKTGLISFTEFCNTTNIPHRVKYEHYPFPDHVMNTFKSLPPNCYKFKSKYRLGKTYSSSTETLPFANILSNGKYQLLTKLPRYEQVDLVDPIIGTTINKPNFSSNSFNYSSCHVPSKEVVQLHKWKSKETSYSINTGYFELENGDYTQDYGFGCVQTDKSCECHHLDNFWEQLGDNQQPFVTDLLKNYENIYGQDVMCKELKPETVFLNKGNLRMAVDLLKRICK